MLNIDKNIFNHNLELTKEYCRLQIEGNEKDTAKVFRSYNPTLNDKPLFSFNVEHFNFEIEPNVNHCTLTNWAIDPIESVNVINDLFIEQLDFKKQSLLNTIFGKEPSGKIIISQIDCTVTDGASEVESLGLIDIYDIPPIDTWFYLTETKEGRLLFGWIPNEFVHYANEAILVNCVDCINWFEEWYYKEYGEIMAKA